MKLLGALAAAAALALANPHPGFAQTPEEVKALGKQVETLRAGQRDIEGELQGLRVLLQSMGDAPPPPLENVVVGVEGAWAPSKESHGHLPLDQRRHFCFVPGSHKDEETFHLLRSQRGQIVRLLLWIVIRIA